jgi:hypothetical protein
MNILLKQNRKLYLLFLLVLIILFAVIISPLTVLDNKNKDERQQTTERPTKLSVNEISQPGNSMELECQPRTHEFYRTQEAFAIDPKNSNILYLAVEFAGVFKSTDGGENWKKITNGITAYRSKNSPSELCYQEFGKILIDPSNSDHILLSRIDSPGTITDIFSENAGLWETLDGGESWKQLISGEMNASGSKGIAINPRDSKMMYYGINNSPSSFGGADKSKFFNKKGILYKTMDGGKSWSELDTGIQEYLRVIDLEIDPQDPNILYLGNFHVSSDGLKDLDPDQSLGFLISKDRGETWSSLSSKLPLGYQAVYDISISKYNSKKMFVVSQPTKSEVVGKSFYSLDKGNTFIESARYMFRAQYDPFDESGNTMIGYNPFTVGNDIFKSKDGGRTWVSISKTGADPSKERFTGITFDASQKGVIYLNGGYGRVIKSVDGGRTWKEVVNYQKLK